MFLLNICPPQGPWPMPPWCSKGFLKNQFTVDVKPTKLSQIKAVNMTDTR
jgi:hypothetical protein